MVTFANLGSVRLQSLEDTAHLVSDVVGPVTLTFDLLTLKRVHGYGPMGFHGAKYGLPGPFSSPLRSRHGTDRQTDDGYQRLIFIMSEVGGIISNRRIGTQLVSAAELTFKRHSMSPAMSPFDTSHMNS